MIISWIQNIKRNIKTKSHLLSVFEIAQIGLLLAIYMIMSMIEKYVFTGAFNISLTYAIYIIFGLALGPWKGAIAGLLCDTLNQVIFGISTWMPEYAIIPIVIAFLAGFFINWLNRKHSLSWTTGFIFLFIVTAIFIYILVKNVDSFPIRETALKRKKVFSLNAVIGISTFGIGTVWLISLTLFIFYKITRNISKKYSSYLFFIIMLTVFAIIIITRWLWGPFAYINYHNRFRSGKWEYSDYYFFFMIPIIFKSLIEIPIYSVIIFAIYPVIKLIRKKIKNITRKINAY
ncbi:ECF transporter S component [Metamycoplasma canadense]|uniref:ECF transporter S component n=1 Tax=Metamycoplasma canadense TaxID=29554 RepID=A0A077L6L2_9BACT|nr:ECF transporter S component [Metamycoplasma canadense]BAP39451.1 hypothetical protein MCAN360_0217 [Metamycoplasma canadense]